MEAQGYKNKKKHFTNLHKTKPSKPLLNNRRIRSSLVNLEEEGMTMIATNINVTNDPLGRMQLEIQGLAELALLRLEPEPQVMTSGDEPGRNPKNKNRSRLQTKQHQP